MGGMISLEYISADVLAIRLGLPRTYLRELIADRQIPFLDVNGRLRFDEGAVREVLRRLAEANGGSVSERNPEIAIAPA